MRHPSIGVDTTLASMNGRGQEVQGTPQRWSHPAIKLGLRGRYSHACQEGFIQLVDGEEDVWGLPSAEQIGRAHV